MRKLLTGMAITATTAGLLTIPATAASAAQDNTVDSYAYYLVVHG